MTRIAAYAANVRSALYDRLQPVDGGPLDGQHILLESDIEAALRDAVVPPPDSNHAEVSEPAMVALMATCHVPHCGERVPVMVRLESYTKARRDSTIIGHVAIGTPTEHVCGQQPLFTPEVEGQTEAWDLPRSGMPTAVAEVVAMLERVGLTLDPTVVDGWTEPEREEAERWAIAAHVASESGEDVPDWPEHVRAAIVAKEPDPCPNPGCVREADHRGRHRKARPPEETTDDPDILPEP